jgi:hypothetical protein
LEDETDVCEFEEMRRLGRGNDKIPRMGGVDKYNMLARTISEQA